MLLKRSGIQRPVFLAASHRFRRAQDLLHVVQYLEEMGMTHRDLKPDNIRIQEYGKNLPKRLKIFDSGFNSGALFQSARKYGRPRSKRCPRPRRLRSARTAISIQDLARSHVQ
jgi:serine/threonine protein kinase